MTIYRYLILFIIPLFFLGCFSTEEQSSDLPKNNIEKIKLEDIPKTITMLFVTQPHCPSCDRLEETMRLEKPAKLIQKYFTKKTLYIGEELPDGLIPPNGTPTVYFLGYKDTALLEPMVGEKDEEGLMMFLEDALLEFETAYGVKLQEQKDNNAS